MKQIIYITLFWLLQFSFVKAQDQRYTNSNLKKEIEILKETGEVFHPVQLLNFKEAAHVNEVGDYFIYEIHSRKQWEMFFGIVVAQIPRQNLLLFSVAVTVLKIKQIRFVWSLRHAAK